MLLLLAGSCAPWQAGDGVPMALQLPAELAAAIVADGCRAAFPGADGDPRPGGLAHRLADGFEVRVYADSDGLWRTSGDTRLRTAWPIAATDPTAMAWPTVTALAAPATVAPAGHVGELGVSITATTDGCEVRARHHGQIQPRAALAELRATLALADRVAAARHRLRSGPGKVVDRLQQAIDDALAAAPQVARPWLASAHFTLAAAHLASHEWGEAEVALDAGLDLAPERHGARLVRAALARRLAHPETGRRDADLVAALPGVDYAGFAADRARVAARREAASTATAWLAAARALAPADLDASLAHARRARALSGEDDAEALQVLAELASRQGQARLACELHLATAMQRPLTSAMRVALARELLRSGDARSAAHWLGEAWGHDADGEAGALLAEVRSALGPEATARALATTGSLALANEIAKPWRDRAGRALLAHRQSESAATAAPATPGR